MTHTCGHAILMGRGDRLRSTLLQKNVLRNVFKVELLLPGNRVLQTQHSA